MRTHIQLVVSHAAVAAVAVSLHLQFSGLGWGVPTVWAVTGAVSVCLGVAATLLINPASALRQRLEIIERAVVDGKKPTGRSPFDRCAERLQGHVQRWSQVATQGRSQAVELDSVLAFFESDEETRRKIANPAKQIRHWLASLGRDSNVTFREMIQCNQEVDGISKVVTSSAQSQNEIASRASREVELLHSDVGDCKQLAEKTQKMVESTLTKSRQTGAYVGQLGERHAAVRAEVGNSEHKVRSMRDLTAEIESMLVVIHEQSAKADMMALNASIEAVRAGELGRGFSVVAEEIRKLAHQIHMTADQTLQRVTSVEEVVDETSGTLAAQRDQLTQQETQLESLLKQVEDIRQATDQTQAQLRRMDEGSENQSRRVTELASAMDEILNGSDEIRNQLVDSGWKTRSLTESISRLFDVLEPVIAAGTEQGAGQEAVPAEEQPLEDEAEAAVCVG